MKTSFSLSVLIIIVMMLMFQSNSVMQVYDFPNGNNFFLSQITDYSLNTKFALILKTKYLGQSKQSFKSEVNGSNWGPGSRSFIVLPVKLDDPRCQKSLNVIFKIDTGLKDSTISREVTEALYRSCPEVPKSYNETYHVQINQQSTNVTETILPLQLFNTLGSEYLFRQNIQLVIHHQVYKKSLVQMKFD